MGKIYCLETMCMIKKQLPDNLSLLAKQLQNSENALKGVAVR